jgi:hypothetical protein
MRVLVCGGRDYRDWQKVRTTLTDLDTEHPITHIIQGGATGADALASQWANSYEVLQTQFSAKWNQYGKRAGYLRNQEMLVKGKPDLVVAFPGGKGTAMMVQLAKDAGVPVLEVLAG